jgi:hypothetical protein
MSTATCARSGVVDELRPQPVFVRVFCAVLDALGALLTWPNGDLEPKPRRPRTCPRKGNIVRELRGG